MLTNIVINLLAVTGIALASGPTRATLTVSAVVRPAARIEALSTTSIRVFATMYPNAQGWVWPTADSCSAPENPQVIATSGFHQLSFGSEALAGKKMICFASSDGLLHASAPLRR